MTKVVLKILLVLIFLANSKIVKAQFVNLRLEIKPELSTTVEQDFDFGNIISNSGRVDIQLGDVNMGVFSIRAFRTQNVYVSLSYPTTLTNNRSNINAELPLHLNLAYNNSGINNAEEAVPITASSGFVSIHDGTKLFNNNDVWKQMYLYVYGYIDVGNVPTGVYTADVILLVDYD